MLNSSTKAPEEQEFGGAGLKFEHFKSTQVPTDRRNCNGTIASNYIPLDSVIDNNSLLLYRQ